MDHRLSGERRRDDPPGDERVRELQIFEEGIDVWRAVGERWRSLAAEAVAARGVFTVALSGGRTPVGFYCYLSRQDGLPWGETELFQVDERHVPSESEASNCAMIRSSLLDGRKVQPRGFHAVDVSAGDASLAAARYEEELRRFFGHEEGGWPVFDLILLGIGQDGHTASLFPGGRELGEEERWVVSSRGKGAAHERITLTLPVLNHCRHAAFLATGREKAGIVRRLRDGEEAPDLPASLVRPKDSLMIYVDREAGSGA